MEYLKYMIGDPIYPGNYWDEAWEASVRGNMRGEAPASNLELEGPASDTHFAYSTLVKLY